MAVAVERTDSPRAPSPRRRASSPARCTPGSAGRSSTSRSSARPSPPSAPGCSPPTASRPRPSLVSKAHLAQAEPQAVVINSGVANAATGKQGGLDALATAAETAALLGLEPEQVLVLSTGVIGVKLPMGKLLAGLGEIELCTDGGADAAEAILTTDTHAEGSGRLRRRVHGRRDGEGRRDDPPVPGDDAGRRHHRLPARRGRGARVPQARPSARASTGSRWTASARRTTRCCCSRTARAGSSGRRRPTASSPPRSRRSAPISRARSSRTARARPSLLEIAVTGAASPGEADAVARRIATSPLVKTAAFGRDPNWGRILAAAGSAFVSGGFAQVDVDGLTLRMNGVARLRATASRPAQRCRSRAPSARSSSTSGSARRRRRYLASDLTYDYVRINAEYTT